MARCQCLNENIFEIANCVFIHVLSVELLLVPFVMLKLGPKLKRKELSLPQVYL